MHKWTGRTAPQKMSFRWLLGIGCLLLSLLITQHVYAWTAQKTLAGNPPGDVPVIALIACLASILYGRWLRGRVRRKYGGE